MKTGTMAVAAFQKSIQGVRSQLPLTRPALTVSVGLVTVSTQGGMMFWHKKNPAAVAAEPIYCEGRGFNGYAFHLSLQTPGERNYEALCGASMVEVLSAMTPETIREAIANFRAGFYMCASCVTIYGDRLGVELPEGGRPRK